MSPIRDSRGFCMKCDPGENGLIVGIISNQSINTAYSGYANQKEASEKKIIKDLFKPNQIAFNTGDILRTDWYGYTYFVDRSGDTFRWRGENVSTIEVENVISSKLNSKEVAVYGVEIPGQEGKAGMATLTSTNVNIKELGEQIIKELPAYAKPLFIRLVTEFDHTGKFLDESKK